MPPRVAPRRGRAVAVDEFGRRRRNKSDAGVVEVTCANSLASMACSREYSYPTGTPSQRTKDAGDAQRWHRGRLALSACPEKSGQKSGRPINSMAEQFEVLLGQAEDNRSPEQIDAAWQRWWSCRQCKQKYHGVVRHALGWAC